MVQRLAIVGASARAAASSALRGGYEVLAFDQFADADLVAACSTIKLPALDDRLLDHFREQAFDAWLYTGGMENRRELVLQLASIKPLLGCDAAALAKVRDPEWLSATLGAAGYEYPTIAFEPPPSSEKSWLVKRVDSGGGIGIKRYTREYTGHEEPNNIYYQRLIEGVPISGMYLAERDSCKLVAAFEQVIGNRWTGVPGEFMYCGADGPRQLSPTVHERLHGMGETLAAAAGLRGLFGIDAILSGDKVTLIEVNPRYTASMELWERATEQSAIDLHSRACRGLPCEVSQADPECVFSKVIIFARQSMKIGPQFEQLVAEHIQSLEIEIADVPPLEHVVAAGEPICTLIRPGHFHARFAGT